MAYQPIQLGRIGALAGIDALDEGFDKAIGYYRDNQQRAAAQLQRKTENERLAKLDFQRAYGEARRLAQSGDMKAAQALMAQYGGTIGEREIPGTPDLTAEEAFTQPGAPPRAPAPGAAPGMPGPAVPAAPKEGLADALNFSFSDYKPPPEGQPPKADELDALMGQSYAGAPANPLIKLMEADKAKQARSVATLTGKFGGQDWTIDPEAQREARGKRLDQAMEGADPETKAEYQRLRPGILMSDADVDVSDIVRSLGASANIRQRQAKQGIDSEHFDRTFDQRAELKEKTLYQSDVNSRRAADAKIRAAAMMAMPGLKIDAANRGDLGKMQQEVKGFFLQADAKGQLKNYSSLHAANANINAEGDDSVLAHRDALVQLAKFFRGSVPTEGEMKVLYDHLGGLYGDMQTAERQILDKGHMSDAMIENLKGSIKIALTEAETRRSQMFSGLADILGPDGAFKNMGPQAQTMLRGYGKLFGVGDISDLIAVDPSQPGAVLGSGRRPTTGRAPGAGAGAKAGPAKKKTADDYLKEGGF